MSFNPFEQEYAEKYSQLIKLEEGRSAITREISWYNDINLELIQEQKKNITDRVNNLQKVQQGIEYKFIDFLLPLKGAIKKYKLNVLNSELMGLEKKENALRKTLKKYKKTDVIHLEHQITVINDSIINFKKDLAPLKKKKEEVDSAISKTVDTIKSKDKELKKLSNELAKAQLLEESLSFADNSYEKAMVHQECEHLFNEGSPSKVIRSKINNIERLKREINKLKNKARNQALRASRIINKVIIDGNNLCYEGEEYVGLEPLKPLVPVLADDYELLVVFDSQIRSMLGKNSSQINSIFENNSKIHIVASGQSADETIVNLASANDSYFILSNDRYIDFQEKNAVKNNRVLRHEIISDRILVNSLGINIKYR